MKISCLAVAALCLSLGACTDIGRIIGGNPSGNPDGDAYAGQPDSVYDVAANAPRVDGAVRYDPNAPMPDTSAPPAAETPPAMAPTPPRTRRP